MKVTITLDDAEYERMLAEVKGDRMVLQRRLQHAVQVMGQVAPNDRFLLLHGDKRRELEGVLQTSADTPERLINFVRNLCTVKIGSVERSFTAGEIERLRMQATFHGWTAEKFLELTSDEAIRYVMDRV